MFMDKTGVSLTVYQTKPKKSVLVLSTVHCDLKIIWNKKKTPESMQFYNETKKMAIGQYIHSKIL